MLFQLKSHHACRVLMRPEFSLKENKSIPVLLVLLNSLPKTNIFHISFLNQINNLKSLFKIKNLFSNIFFILYSIDLEINETYIKMGRRGLEPPTFRTSSGRHND